MFHASFHLNLSEPDDDNGKRETLSLFCDLYQNSNSTFSYFICLPNLLLFHTVKKFIESSTTTEEALMLQFINLLKEVKFNENIIHFLSKQVEVEIESNLYIQYQVFVCFTRILSIYNFLVKLYRGNISNIELVKVLFSRSNPFEQFECLDNVQTKKERSIFSSTVLTSFPDSEVTEAYFTNLIVDVLHRLCFLPESISDSFMLKRARWDLLALSCNTLSSSKLHQFVSSSLPPSANIDAIKPIQLLRWLLQCPFIDNDENIRFYSCKKIGPLLLSKDFKILKILFGQDSNNFDHFDLVGQLFSDIDDLLSRHCGLMQSLISSTIKTYSTCTNHSTWNSELEDTSINRSKTVSSILAISSLCGNAEYNNQEGKHIIQKGVMRLVRLWAIVPDTPYVFSSSSILHNNYNHTQVALVAFHELVKLNQKGIFCQKMVEWSEDLFLPGLFAELLSQGIIEQSVYGKNDTLGFKDYKMLIKMIQTFFLKKTTPTCTEDNWEILSDTLSYVDKILPEVIKGLILIQDYETLCSCTAFRMYLLSEDKRLEKHILAKQNEKVMVTQYKKRQFEGRKNMNTKELQAQTGNLCCSDETVKVLTKVLPALLMEPDKTPLLFYLRTVLQCKVPLGHLIKSNELKIIEQIFWELGGEDNEIDDDYFTMTPKAWLEAKSSNNAIQGLKKCAIIIKKVDDKKNALQVNSNETIQSLEVLSSLDLNDPSTECSIETEKWIHKHFMMLLVKCVTIKWKIGKIKTKIRAMNCLRVLIRFLRASDCAQYITQVLTMIDSAMNFRHDNSDPVFTKSKLQLLAMKALVHFVHVLLSHQFEAVGENLCKIIVSILPLFDSDPSMTNGCNRTDDSDPFVDNAISQAVTMMESLSEGDSGKKLAPYFNDVPFFPKHPRLQHARESLRRIGINFDHPLQMPSELTCDSAMKTRETPTSTSSSSIDDRRSNYDNMMQAALRQRLHCLKRLFNHENDNVRKVVLEHLTALIRGNRELFYDLVKTEDASLQFLTVQSDNKIGEESVGTHYNGKRIQIQFFPYK